MFISLSVMYGRGIRQLTDFMSFKMDRKENLTYLSPIISKNTPIKRLGLSRKRKSPSVENQPNKLQAKILGDSPLTTYISTKHDEEENEVVIEVNNKQHCDNLDKSSPSHDSVESLKERIEEKEECLRVLKESSNNAEIKELEDLYQVWKNGCKKGLIQLLALIKERQPEFNNIEQLSQKLGIWDIIHDNFQDDLDFLALEK